jgi:hypothetical protein
VLTVVPKGLSLHAAAGKWSPTISNGAATQAVNCAFAAFQGVLQPGAKVHLHINNTSRLSSVTKGALPRIGDLYQIDVHRRSAIRCTTQKRELGIDEGKETEAR